jgi:hypothetical protein
MKLFIVAKTVAPGSSVTPKPESFKPLLCTFWWPRALHVEAAFESRVYQSVISRHQPPPAAESRAPLAASRQP